MKILAIDPGTEGFGWACGSPDRKPTFGTYKPLKAGADLGAFLIDVRTFLWPWLIDFNNRLTEIVYESPVFVASNNVNTLRKMFALGGYIETLGYDHGIAVSEAAPSTVRKYFLGSGMTPRRSAQIKIAVMARCRQLGWQPKTDHEADALAILDFATTLKGSRLAQMGLI